MSLTLQKIRYRTLSSKQKEGYNFQKVSAALAEYGYATIRLTDDWQGADFIAQHRDGLSFLKVQLKGRLTFDKKYAGKEIYIVFPYKDEWYIYDHDELLLVAFAAGIVESTTSWKDAGAYSFPHVPGHILKSQSIYKL